MEGGGANQLFLAGGRRRGGRTIPFKKNPSQTKEPPGVKVKNAPLGAFSFMGTWAALSGIYTQDSQVE
jgi:hypothetical protein